MALILRNGQLLRDLALLAGVACACACGGDDPEPNREHDAGPAEAMGCPDSVPTFSFGEEHGLMVEDAESGVRARLIDSSSALPYNGLNDWTLAITDLDGAPLVDARLNWACAYMPGHYHGSQPRRVEVPEPGQLLLSAQNLSMDGVWKIRLWISPTAEGPEFTPQAKRGVGFDRDACLPRNGADAMWNLEFTVCVPMLHD